MPRLFPSLFLIMLTLLVPLNSLFPDVSAIAGTDDRKIAQSDRMHEPQRLIRGESVNCPRPAPAAEPLDPPTTSSLAGTRRFSAGEHFRENIAPSADVRVAWLGAMFVRRFAIKIEDAGGETALQFHTVLRPSRDRHIIAELDDRHETRLADLWCLLKIQASGEPGTLLTDAVPNIFYVRDSSDVLGAIDAVWGGAGWEIGASPVDGERKWPVGVRVISR